ncbi:hypothetical protein BCR43DRAFT_486992 [Syncephalastrum racemosum]|uniref:RING-type domain-containing protein n=1 Tax=Syncephalastrum racemosum TaxID=13706 RepID=A0A1X2HQ09_SYNRA|nr:hypothetical protein BCR43DRAFT_486992 [Syncephalastrum racemosum]
MIVLLFSWEMYCDKPLRVFLTVYILRLVLSCPISVYLHLIPRRRLQANNNPDLASRQEAGEIYAMTERRPVATSNITTLRNHPTVTIHSSPPSSSSSSPPVLPITTATTTTTTTTAISAIPTNTNATTVAAATSATLSTAYQHSPSIVPPSPPRTTAILSSQRHIPSSATPAAATPVGAASASALSAAAAHHANQAPIYRDSMLTSWVDRAKSALDVFAFMWFIFGNYMIFTSTTCSETAVPLYYLSLILIIYGYIIVTVPILLCTAVIFCLPCVLVGMRVLHVGDAVDMGGASTEEIAKIPVYQFRSSKPHAATPVVVAPARPSALEDIEMQSVPKKQPATGKKQEQSSSLGLWDRIWLRLGFEDDTQVQGQNEPEYAPIEIPNEQDQVCAICLSTYDDGDILCKLWCSHHFHKTCVHEWLVLNSRCPMCKRDSRAKNPEDLTRL